MTARNVVDAGLEAGPLPRKDIEVADDAESSANGEGGVVADTARVQDHEAEVRLCRKFDVRLLPVLAFMCKSWDEENLGSTSHEAREESVPEIANPR